MNTDPKHGPADLLSTGSNKAMSALKLAGLIPRRKELGSRDREIASFAGSLRLRRDARSACGRAEWGLNDLTTSSAEEPLQIARTIGPKEVEKDVVRSRRGG